MKNSHNVFAQLRDTMQSLDIPDVVQLKVKINSLELAVRLVHPDEPWKYFSTDQSAHEMAAYLQQNGIQVSLFSPRDPFHGQPAPQGYDLEFTLTTPEVIEVKFKLNPNTIAASPVAPWTTHISFMVQLDENARIRFDRQLANQTMRHHPQAQVMHAHPGYGRPLSTWDRGAHRHGAYPGAQVGSGGWMSTSKERAETPVSRESESLKAHLRIMALVIFKGFKKNVDNVYRSIPPGTESSYSYMLSRGMKGHELGSWAPQVMSGADDALRFFDRNDASWRDQPVAADIILPRAIGCSNEIARLIARSVPGLNGVLTLAELAEIFCVNPMLVGAIKLSETGIATMIKDLEETKFDEIDQRHTQTLMAAGIVIDKTNKKLGFDPFAAGIIESLVALISSRITNTEWEAWTSMKPEDFGDCIMHCVNRISENLKVIVRDPSGKKREPREGTTKGTLEFGDPGLENTLTGQPAKPSTEPLNKISDFQTVEDWVNTKIIDGYPLSKVVWLCGLSPEMREEEKALSLPYGETSSLMIGGDGKRGIANDVDEAERLMDALSLHSVINTEAGVFFGYLAIPRFQHGEADNRYEQFVLGQAYQGIEKPAYTQTEWRELGEIYRSLLKDFFVRKFTHHKVFVDLMRRAAEQLHQRIQDRKKYPAVELVYNENGHGQLRSDAVVTNQFSECADNRSDKIRAELAASAADRDRLDEIDTSHDWTREAVKTWVRGLVHEDMKPNSIVNFLDEVAYHDDEFIEDDVSYLVDIDWHTGINNIVRAREFVNAVSLTSILNFGERGVLYGRRNIPTFVGPFHSCWEIDLLTKAGIIPATAGTCLQQQINACMVELPNTSFVHEREIIKVIKHASELFDKARMDANHGTGTLGSAPFAGL